MDVQAVEVKHRQVVEVDLRWTWWSLPLLRKRRRQRRDCSTRKGSTGHRGYGWAPRHHCCGHDAWTPMPSHPSSSSTSSDWTQAMLVCSTSAGSAPSIHPWPSQPWSLVCTTSSALCVPNHVSPSRRPCGNRNKPFAPIAAGLVYVGELLRRSSPSLYHRLISTSATRHLAERARVVLLQVHLSERSRLYT